MFDRALNKPMLILTLYPFHDGIRYHTETSSLNCTANQWTGFYMTAASILKELSANHTKWSNTLKQFVGYSSASNNRTKSFQTITVTLLSVFNYFEGLALKWL